eukprot:9900386-Ditylum_brightwellii.AAC.1
MEHLAKYLAAMKVEGLLLEPNMEKCFKVHADANFIGNWMPNNLGVKDSDADSASTCKAEYLALSNALKDAIPMM